MAETTSDNGDATTDFDPFDGFNVVDELPLQQFVDFGFDSFGEYIHIVPDPERRQLRVYRSVSDATEENERISTVIDDVKITYHYDNYRNDRPEVNHFYLTGTEAMTFLSFLDLLGSGREGRLTFEWWEESGMPMMEDEKTDIEILTFTFDKPNGVNRTVSIDNPWQSPKAHRMANLDGEVL
jgi:hypothetical protein